MLYLAKRVSSAHPASSKIKAPFQVFRAKHVQQVTTALSRAPRPAPILVSSNLPIARTTSSLTLPFVNVCDAHPVHHALVPSHGHKSKQNLVGSNVQTIIQNLSRASILMLVLADRTKISQETFRARVILIKLILLSVLIATSRVQF